MLGIVWLSVRASLAQPSLTDDPALFEQWCKTMGSEVVYSVEGAPFGTMHCMSSRKGVQLGPTFKFQPRAPEKMR